ncbi:hypothetical protein Scep_018773 [Stephania cephalantha]|uniref:Pentatricopeptide repeat-containing protein n=1 Tax=Stephania cephalantha TaxID=152367 RepID=A0AAP0I9P0_9MAGN
MEMIKMKLDGCRSVEQQQTSEGEDRELPLSSSATLLTHFCGEWEHAQKVFDKMPVKNVCRSSIRLVKGLVSCGGVWAAHEVFEGMTVVDGGQRHRRQSPAAMKEVNVFVCIGVSGEGN